MKTDTFHWTVHLATSFCIQSIENMIGKCDLSVLKYLNMYTIQSGEIVVEVNNKVCCSKLYVIIRMYESLWCLDSLGRMKSKGVDPGKQ